MNAAEQPLREGFSRIRFTGTRKRCGVRTIIPAGMQKLRGAGERGGQWDSGEEGTLQDAWEMHVQP